MSKSWLVAVGMSTIAIALLTEVGMALPPPEDIPEEVLRTEIVTEGRSPVDGQPLTAAEYAQIQAELAQSPYPPQINSRLRHLIFLLQIRKLLRTVTPF